MENLENTSDAVLNCEPGASAESMLVTTDSFEEFTKDVSCREEELKENASTISEIQVKTQDVKSIEEENLPNILKSVSDEVSSQKSETSVNSNEDSSQINNDDYMRNTDWLNKQKHIFILSSAGKPIYARYGNEEKLATTFGVMQALVSVVQSNNDVVRSVHTMGTEFVFLVKGPLILVAVSKTKESVSQLILQLTYVFNQIISILTLSTLTRIYEQRRNYDLRRMLAGSERLIDHLLNFMENEPAFLLGAIKCLPLGLKFRDTITHTIINVCSKIKNLVFAILIAKDQLVTLVRMKKYVIHPADLHLIMNLVRCSESFKAAESWTPICLPKFDSSGFLHGHVSYLAEDCQACLLLLTVDRDVFFVLSEAKQKITEKLRRSNCLEAINDSMNQHGVTPQSIGIGGMRHFLYKCKSTAQLFGSAVQAPYTLPGELDRLFGIYQSLHHKIHNTARPLKLLYQQLPKETMLVWITVGFEMYITFDPLIEKQHAIDFVNKLLKWIKKEEERLFILNAPTF